jgi:hypothetical protein
MQLGATSRCHRHPECPNTAGYYFGGGIWICWLHTLFDEVLTGVIARTGQKMQALPEATCH